MSGYEGQPTWRTFPSRGYSGDFIRSRGVVTASLQDASKNSSKDKISKPQIRDHTWCRPGPVNPFLESIRDWTKTAFINSLKYSKGDQTLADSCKPRWSFSQSASWSNCANLSPAPRGSLAYVWMSNIHQETLSPCNNSIILQKGWQW